MTTFTMTRSEAEEFFKRDAIATYNKAKVLASIGSEQALAYLLAGPAFEPWKVKEILEANGYPLRWKETIKGAVSIFFDAFSLQFKLIETVSDNVTTQYSMALIYALDKMSKAQIVDPIAIKDMELARIEEEKRIKSVKRGLFWAGAGLLALSVVSGGLTIGVLGAALARRAALGLAFEITVGIGCGAIGTIAARHVLRDKQVFDNTQEQLLAKMMRDHDSAVTTPDKIAQAKAIKEMASTIDGWSTIVKTVGEAAKPYVPKQTKNQTKEITERSKSKSVNNSKGK